MLWWWGYTEPVSPRPPRLHRISTVSDGRPKKRRPVAMGQQRTHALRQTTSLFDHLIGSRQQQRRDSEADRVGGLEINNQCVLGRRLHWQIGGLLAFEDAIDITGRAPVRRWDPAHRRRDPQPRGGHGEGSRAFCESRSTHTMATVLASRTAELAPFAANAISSRSEPRSGLTYHLSSQQGSQSKLQQ
jgi:hypothetical protein